MVFNFETVAIVIGLLWLIGITIYIFRVSSHYNKITKGVSGKTLKSILEDLLKQVADSQKQINTLAGNYETLKTESVSHIQKVGLTRFNPFKDTGGEQSFILALLDGSDSGVVISSLYARSGTRWYSKSVVGGKGVEHELSEEEKKALKEAKILLK